MPIATPTIRIGSVVVKMECFQQGGSHKARAAHAVVLDAERRRLIRPRNGDIIVEKSGGNFGVALALIAKTRGYDVKLLVRPSFSQFRRDLLEQLGAELIGRPEMADNWTNQQILNHYIEKYRAAGHNVYWPDQFSNPACLEGHAQAGERLVEELTGQGLTPDSELIFVGGVGTGASIMGYARSLRQAFPKVRVVVAEPENCSLRESVFASGHKFQGLAVGVVPPLFDPGQVDDYINITEHEADASGEYLLENRGWMFGPSTQLVYAAARTLAKGNDCPIVMIAYDTGDTYFVDTRARPAVKTPATGAGVTTDLNRLMTLLGEIRDQFPANPEMLGLSSWDLENILDKSLSEIREDQDAYYSGDPAAKSLSMVEESYLSFRAVAYYRVMNKVYNFDNGIEIIDGHSPVKIFARRKMDQIKAGTGVEIHPAATIGRHFVIDHGLNVVIGETTEIGDHCYILNDVTLGARGIARNAKGRRHPKLGNGVEIGAHSRILGPVTIGDHVFIAPNMQVTHDIPSHHKLVLQQEFIILKSKVESETGGDETPEFHYFALLSGDGNRIQLRGRNLTNCTLIAIDTNGSDDFETHAKFRISDLEYQPADITFRVDLDADVDAATVGFILANEVATITLTKSLHLKRLIEDLRNSTP